MVGVLLESVAYQKYIGSCSGHEGKKMDVKRTFRMRYSSSSSVTNSGM